MPLFKKTAATKMWFQDFEIGLLSWSSFNPDLNPIEYVNPAENSSKKVYNQKKLPKENIVERKKEKE